MNFERGLGNLDQILLNAGLRPDSEQYLKFIGWRRQLLASLERERRYTVSSPQEQERQERVLSELDRLAFRYARKSFLDLCAYAIQIKPEPSFPGLTPYPHSVQNWVTFKLQLVRQAGIQFESRALATPMGEPRANGQLPFDAIDLIAVLKVLENSGYDPTDFTSVQTGALQRLGLLHDGRLTPGHLKRIGKGLYDALFPGDVGLAFKMALNQARLDRTTILLQLRFDDDAVDLARYPWELLHDGQRHMVSAGAVELTRYITYAEAAPRLPVKPPARLLFVESRPQDLPTLPPESERLVVWASLQTLTTAGKLATEHLERPTYDALLDRIASADYHMIHFDGHGLFARPCPQCRAMNYAHLTTCHSCQTSLEDVQPQGFLVFEGDSGKADLVSTEHMENLLLNSQVRLMFLSACQTGVVRGDSLFGGLGPGLIRAGVPAVVAMQFSVPVQTTISFANSFYTALARGETVSRAVAQGRQRLFRDDTWFIPTLYLRSQDDEGHILAP